MPSSRAPREVSAPQRCAAQAAEAKICIAEIGPIQAGSAEVGPLQISCFEVCIAQVGMHQIGIGQLAVRAQLVRSSKLIKSSLRGRKRGSEQHCQQEQHGAPHGQWVTLVM